DAGVKRFVFAASSAAYGDIEAQEKSEDLPPSPLSPYAAQKLACELYCQVFHRLYGLETVALRYFNVFGPRQDPNSQYAAVVPKFITMMLNGDAPVIDGDGEQSRDFTFVENVVHANWLACTSLSGAAGQVINAACGERVGVKQRAQCVREILGCDGAAVHGPPRAGDVKHSLADLTKARALLGYEPVVPFAEGIRRTVAWYREQSA
ncbi:MAG: NAD-dependent epimerase/dehydratase family protein, partial [Candidatus Hydrogenedentes bacterium]|nr:NAD-dependent epimerase/dehydratase family protein [Candidatus Hydrogenedentota bacterium]